MLEQPSRGWLPPVLGVAALLLAVDTARQLIAVPPQYCQGFLFGIETAGVTAYAASVLTMLFYAWLSAGAFRRRAQMVWAVVGYSVYLIVSVWVWTTTYATQSLQTQLITASTVTVLLLVLCRFVIDRREQFDG
jgi:hypothetical protein